MRTVMAFAALTLSARIVTAQEVSYDYDKTAAFAGYHTYAWVTGHPVDDALNHKRIVAAVDSQLKVKGFRLVDGSEHPDVLVAYHASFGKNVQVTGFSNGWGGYRFANRSASARAEEITVGTLVIDLVDAATRSIVWRGTASKDLDPKASPEKRDKNINRAVEKVFRKYPPSN